MEGLPRLRMGRSETRIFSSDPSKAWFEKFSLSWAPASLVILLVGVLGSGARHYWDKYSYLGISITLCLPGVTLPILFPGEMDKHRRFSERFWVKAAVWIGIFSFYGNYFWTHYFYQLLGARYLFDAHRFNDVPIVCYLCTYFYFTFYFAFVNVILRAVRRFGRVYHLQWYVNSFIWWGTIFSLAYGTAVFEAVSIQHFPLYTYSDKKRFVTVGSIVYGIYFIIGFPMFFAIDEPDDDGEDGGTVDMQNTTRIAKKKSTLYEVMLNSLAATAIVTLLLDLWRLYLGSIYALGRPAPPVPFIYQGATSRTLFQQIRDRVSDASILLRFNGSAMLRRWSQILKNDFLRLNYNLVCVCV